MSHCHPSVRTQGTCYDKKSLAKISRAAGRPFVQGETVYDLWTGVRDDLRSVCGDDETCWMRAIDKATASRIEASRLRPAAPRQWVSEPKAWLSDQDIATVMSQYVKKYRDFDFLGVVPLDFAERLESNVCVSRRMCDLDVDGLVANGKRRLGVVVNMDTHEKSGSHWVAFFIDVGSKTSPGGTYYYDSLARAPPAVVTRYLWQVTESIRRRAPKHKMRYNTVRTQWENTECGMFCIHFLKSMLKENDPDFDKVCNEMPRDEKMFEMRNFYFRNGSKK